jgi:hypothetical protein
MVHQGDISEQKKRNIMHSLSSLPRKILQLHGRDNVAEFVLHELGKEDCFNLERAAYIVDNPDFDCLKGVAGYCRPEAYHSDRTIWEDPESFSKHMQQSSFNNKIRYFYKPSAVRKKKTDQQIVEAIAKELDFVNPSFYAWRMKHDNHGILLYEKLEPDVCDCEYLLEGLCLIGFCPIF